MKKILKIVIPLLLAVAIIGGIGWYLLEYDPGFTRDLLLEQARKWEDSGEHDAAVWLYNLAYELSDKSDEVAIELAEKFKSIGNYTKAEYTLARAIEDGGTPALYIALCKTYVEQNKLRDAAMMLDKIGNAEIKAQLDAMRPAAPSPSVASGKYAQYISLELSAPGCKVYVATGTDYPSTETDTYAGPISLPGGETTLSAISVGENGLVSSLTVFRYIIGGVIEEVIFEDTAFELAVRTQLEIEDDRPIYSNELWPVTEFEIPATVSSCADLKWLPYLQKLTIHGSTYENLDILATLPELQEVHMDSSVLGSEDLRTIASLPKLTALTLSGCNISTIADLENATGLTYLNLNDNTLRDISVLSSMTSLQELHIRNNALISLESIAGLTALTVLDISYNPLVSIAPVAGLLDLTKLDISSTGLRSLEGIEALVGLTELSVAYNNLLDADSLSACTELKYLDISNNTLLNINVLASLKKLEELDFSHNEVSALPKLSQDHALRIINGEYNQLKSLDALSGLLNLGYIDMDYNASLSSIDSLRYCPVLVKVEVWGTKVRDVPKAIEEAGIIVIYTPL